jgi:predicted acyl esterase
VQSSLFPLYDRNPQTFVPNIMTAKPADYRKATQSVWFGGSQASAIILPVTEP